LIVTEENKDDNRGGEDNKAANRKFGVELESGTRPAKKGSERLRPLITEARTE